MEPPTDRIRLSQAAKDRLTKLKRLTKIDRWNILCRWALCRSLAEPTLPPPAAIAADSNLEMTWGVFGGEIGDLLLIALKQRCHNDGLSTDKDTLTTQLRIHIHRGIDYLAGDPNMQQIEDLIALGLDVRDRG
jgi:DNA sulfur modification protein DndE